MSWKLTRLALYSTHRPADPIDRLLLVAVAEAQHNPGHEVRLSYAHLADAIGRGESATKVRVKRLVADGLLLRTPGPGRKVKNGYRIAVDRLAAGPENQSVWTDQFEDSETGRSEPTGLDENQSVSGPKPVGLDRPRIHRAVKEPSSSAPDAPMDGVLVGVTRAADDDEIRESLQGIPGVPPGGSATVRSLVGEYLADGWTAVQVNALLRLSMDGNPANPMGCLTAVLRDHRGEPPPRPKVGPWDPSTWCGECDQHSRWREDENGTPRKCPTCHPARPVVAAAFNRMTSGDKRRMIGGRR